MKSPRTAERARVTSRAPLPAPRMEADEALLRLDARCPECGKRPKARIPAEERDLARTLPPDRRRQTEQCTGCGTIYWLTARAYARAA